MTSKILLFTVICVLLQATIFAEKVLIITSAYNRPDFIEVQNKTFKKFLRDEYEFVVFNDARELSLQHAIENTCAQCGIRCINIPQFIHDLPYLKREPGEGFHNGAVRNANVVQYALNHIGFSHNGIVAIVDSDMFLVQPFSIKEFLAGYEIAGVPQSCSKEGVDIRYLWIGIAFLDMAKLPEKELINFNCGKIQNVPVDAGGYIYYYLQRYPELKIRPFAALHSGNISRSTCRELGDELIDCISAGLANVEVFINGVFLHYRGGTNWDHQTSAFHENKTRLFTEYIEKILSSTPGS